METKGALIILSLAIMLSLCSAGIVSATGCGIRAYGTDITDSGTITATIENTGSSEEAVNYIFYVNGEAVYTGFMNIGAGETRPVGFDYPFGEQDSERREYDIELRAEALCGAEDMDGTFYIVFDLPEGIWLDNYRCSGNWVQRQWRLGDRTAEWRNYEQCSYACSAGACLPEPPACGFEDECAVCGVEIADVDTYSYVDSEDETIHVFGVETENTGNWHETVSLYLHIDDTVIDFETFGIEAGGLHESIFYLNGMESGEYAIEAVAESGCGSMDSRFFILDVPGPESHEGECGLDVETLDYNSHITQSDTGWVKVTATNTWNDDETIHFRLYIDGEEVSVHSENAIVQGMASHIFYYSPEELGLREGSHEIRADAYTDNGCLNIRQATVYIYEAADAPMPICNYNNVCEVGWGEDSLNCPHDCPAEPELEVFDTLVRIVPSSLDIYLCDSKVITLEVTSSIEQDFGISVVGVNDDWISYETVAHAESGRNRFYVYVTPKDTGSYEIGVLVTALTEGVSFSSEIPVYVAPQRQDSVAGGFGPLFSFFFATHAGMALFLAAFSLIIIVAGALKLKGRT